MTIKRAPPRSLSVDERARATAAVKLLITITKRTTRLRCKAATSDKRKTKKKSKNTKKKGLSYDPKNIGSWQHGPFVFEACFFA